MKAIGIIPLGLVCFTVGACGSGGKSGGDNSPTAPPAIAVPAPAGCSGSAVDQVKLSISVGGGGSINLQMFGETFNQSIPAGQQFEVIRALVPCTYEINGQMLNRNLEIGFGRGNGISTSDVGGVERGSIVVDQGPSPTFTGSGMPCKVQFTALPESGLNPPLPIKIRFRIATTNGLGGILNQASGCS